MRATRAYLAGFGTSGSMLAGAAVLFLLGSAIVAFKGWPQIGTTPATSNIGAAAVPVSSRVARRLTFVLATTRRHALVGVASRRKGGTARGHNKALVVGGAPGGVAPQTGSVSGSTATSSGGSGAVAGGPTACSSCSQPSSQGTVTSLTDTVAQTVSTVGTNVGNQIKTLSGSTARQIDGASPQAGSSVGSAGSSAGSTVTGTSTTAAAVVTTVGNVAGGGGR